jgi:hypothetical protein
VLRAKRERPSAPSLRQARAIARSPLAGAAAALALAGLGGCGTPNAKVLEADKVERHESERQHQDHSEADKIREVIAAVRASGVTFVDGDREVPCSEHADDLEHRAARMSVSTARQFVDIVGSPKHGAKVQPKVRLSDGTVVAAHDWYIGRLDEIEGTSGKHTRKEQVAGAKPTSLGILDALTIVERSGKRFVAPPRRLPSGKVKGKRKEYSANEFAEMLRKKWEFLGADVRDLDTFIEEIATDSFASMAPYRVIHEDGSEEEFRAWLKAQLDLRRQALAKGGAP